VDGAQPKVELARKHGIRYLHLPHGYDGINAEVQARLVKAAQQTSDPLFVHCHHGLHRGPAAMAVICMSKLNWSPQIGEAWLKAAGTGSNYVGLFQTVRDFQPFTTEQLSNVATNFPEAVKPSGLVEAMVAIDERWDHLKSVRKAGYAVPKEYPDIDPAHEVFLLREDYREAQRLPDSVQHGEDFIVRLKQAEEHAKTAEQLLRAQAASPNAKLNARLDAAFDAIAQNCTSCHRAHRDKIGHPSSTHPTNGVAGK
jgi:hypothetical protein